ncbi:polysaccharide deacetylase [Terrimicrobium sacchariphilum]|jgi:peptidoglycan/xylan/chitin deacetylase (PgdA/CDA1 family)|uniref:Polysaccharide deacetylase n=1 Tax=Terrimicrobium sacchariphilum TaxID=690879 RepID=A0A146GBM2_TERSA|nr:polysaccharide deacetylase family protein [Terrimicrobium sacchariphilum]GAT34592.1 polysaccharide deacetylase [Terrimicrobium sacchariphilum]
MNPPARVEITRFPEGKRIALTTSFDDGQTFDRRIVAAFNEWGLKATFNINSGKLQRTGKPAVEGPLGRGERVYLDASEIRELFQGHEVAIHTVTHPWLERLEASQIAREVLDDRIALEDLVGYPVRGMAYPFGTYDDRVIAVLRGLGIVYSRTCRNDANCFPPADPLDWATTAHQYAENPSVPDRFAAVLGNPWWSGVFYIWGHGFEFHDRDDWAGLERIFKPLSGHADVWYCTNIELFDYEEARRRIIISANRKVASNPSALTVWLKVDGQLVAIRGGESIALCE